jgi:hypothetical protein
MRFLKIRIDIESFSYLGKEYRQDAKYPAGDRRIVKTEVKIT